MSKSWGTTKKMGFGLKTTARSSPGSSKCWTSIFKNTRDETRNWWQSSHASATCSRFEHRLHFHLSPFSSSLPRSVSPYVFFCSLLRQTEHSCITLSYILLLAEFFCLQFWSSMEIVYTAFDMLIAKPSPRKLLPHLFTSFLCTYYILMLNR